MARTSARSSATRDQASSPPKQSSDRQSQSPVGRRTRSTRSQSTDIGESEMVRPTKRGGKRGARQASVESVDSNTSAASSRGGRARRATRATASVRDLSMVAEDRETEEDEDDENGESDEGAARAQRSHSPGGMSQMSGTTAISSFSARTSHSQGEIGALDPMVAEYLPDLWNDSYRILSLLAPTNASEEEVESIVRELKVSGSRLAKSLRQNEKRFGVSREHYGNEHYIKATLIFRKLLGSPDPAEENSRPDAIIHAANIATLVKEFLVIQKESQSTLSIVGGLDTSFPEVFVTKFADNTRFGNSLLLDESFELALDIRTQLTIVTLLFHKDQETWDPDQILASNFYNPPQQTTPPLSYFEDSTRNGQPKDIMNRDLANTGPQNARVLERVKLIHSAFRQSNDALEAGDLVDFDQLEELFPWVKFVTDLVHWSRLRMEEISQGIKQQGGVDSITKSFIMAVKEHDSQVEINYDPPPPSSVRAPRQLQPPAEIVPGASNQSLYNGNRDMVRHLERFKRLSSSLDAPPPNQQKAISATSSSAPQPISNSQGASRTVASKAPPGSSRQNFDDSRPDMDDRYVEHPRPAEEYAQVWASYTNEGNKENRPAPRPKTKMSLLDRQPGARRVGWNDTQDSVAGPSTQKRPRPPPEAETEEEEEDSAAGPSTQKRSRPPPEAEMEEDSEEEEVSEDEGFEDDRRVPDPNRRDAARSARRQSPVDDAGDLPPKRQRVERPVNNVDHEPVHEAVGRRQQREKVESRASARYEDVNEDEEDEEDHPPPTYTQTSIAARLNSVRARINNEPQKRTPWSEADSQRLIDGIERFGCSWTLIAQNIDFEHPRDQVALKDKARNMKVNFLKAGVLLPLNFENVALGKKEIAAVRRLDPDYEP